MQHFESDLKVLVTLIAIRKLRRLKHINMAIALIIDRSSYSKLERGKVTMSRGKFFKIADTLKTNINSILVIANAIDHLDVEEKNIEQILDLFLKIYAPRAERLEFTSEELFFIFATIKRFYPKMIGINTNYSTA